MLCLQKSHDFFDIMTLLPHPCFLPIWVSLERQKKSSNQPVTQKNDNLTELSNRNANFLSVLQHKQQVITETLNVELVYSLLCYVPLFSCCPIYFCVVIYLYLFWDGFQGLQQLLNTVGYLTVALWVISQLTKSGRTPLWPSVCL